MVVLPRMRNALLLLGFASTALYAQETGAAPQHSAVHRPMQLTLSLNGAPVQDLQQNEIRLMDNGQLVQPQSLRRVQQTGQPTHVIIVIDDVNARLSTIAYERDELKHFLTRNDGKLNVALSIAVMTDTKTDIQQGFSQNGFAQNEVLQKYQIGLHEIHRDSQYGGFDRTQIGIRTMQQLVAYAGTIPGHKVILFLSPGWPLLTGPSIELTAKQQNGLFETVAQLQDAMLRADVTLDMVNPFGPAESVLRSDYYQAYLKGVKNPSGTEIADLSLQVLAVHSGGTVLQGSSDIANMIDKTLADLGHAYTLSYEPAGGGTETALHSLQVQLTRPGIAVRSPDEYYDLTAQPVH